MRDWLTGRLGAVCVGEQAVGVSEITGSDRPVYRRGEGIAINVRRDRGLRNSGWLVREPARGPDLALAFAQATATAPAALSAIVILVVNTNSQTSTVQASSGHIGSVRRHEAPGGAKTSAGPIGNDAVLPPGGDVAESYRSRRTP